MDRRRIRLRPTLVARRGFTLAEVIVSLILIAALGAVLVPQVVQRLRDGQAAAIANNLNGIRTALLEYRKAIGRYPSQLAYLATQPTPGATDLCARNVPIDWSAMWRGPYLQQAIGASGVSVRDATILNALRREPATIPLGLLANLFIDVTSVDQDVAEIIERSFDPTVDFAAGTIRWVATGGGQGTLSLVMPVRGC
ncbi:MAG: type II secretion system protein [Gemmatimonadaceae bacterium]